MNHAGSYGLQSGAAPSQGTQIANGHGALGGSPAPDGREGHVSQLVMDNLGLARSAVRRTGRPATVYFDSEDLMQSAMLGLVQAAHRYRPERGVRFSTFAVPRIRGAIVDSMRAADWVPRTVRQKLRDDDFVPAVHHFHAAFPSDSDEHRGEFLEDTRVERPENGAERNELKEQLAKAIQALPDQQKTVIMLGYYKGLRLTEIANTLGVTRGRVSQIHSQAVGALRKALDPDGTESED